MAESSKNDEHVSKIKEAVDDIDLTSCIYFSLNKDDNGIAQLTINNVDCSTDDQEQTLLGEMSQVISDLENWSDGKCVIMTGLHVFPLKWSPTVAEQLKTQTDRMLALPLLLVAILEGWVSGGGSQLAITCDFRAMTESAHIAFVEWGSALDMVKESRPDILNGGSRLAQLLRQSKAVEVAISGHPIGTQEATEMGLNQYVVTKAGEDMVSEVRQWLDQYTKWDRDCLRAIKRIVHYACTLPLDEALRKERDLFATVWGGPAHRAALAANLKHRSN